MYGRTGLLMSKQASRQSVSQSFSPFAGRSRGFGLLCECEARGLRIRIRMKKYERWKMEDAFMNQQGPSSPLPFLSLGSLSCCWYFCVLRPIWEFGGF
jgi:hypothetical protein